MEYIAENTYQYYLAQNTDTTYTKSLQKALAETEKLISNLLRAIEAGIFNESTKERMDELDEQKSQLNVALAAAKLKEDLGLKKEHIVFFLHQFAKMDYTDIDCQKRLIKTFVNSVFVYDDKVVLTFNYSGDHRTITLKEIDGGLGHSIRIPSAVVHQKEEDTFWYLPLFCSRGDSNNYECNMPPVQTLVASSILPKGQNANESPVAVPGRSVARQAGSLLADRCHSLSSLSPPPAAVASLPSGRPVAADNSHGDFCYSFLRQLLIEFVGAIINRPRALSERPYKKHR